MRVGSAEKLGTISKINLRENLWITSITSTIRKPTWGIHSLTLSLACKQAPGSRSCHDQFAHSSVSRSPNFSPVLSRRQFAGYLTSYIIHLMYGPKGNSSFCFPSSPDVSRDEVEGNIRTQGKTKLTSFPRRIRDEVRVIAPHMRNKKKLHF